MYLQLTIPGKFKVAACTNPDQSPNGQLPFLTHGHLAVTTFPSVIAFIASLARSSGASDVLDLDASLTPFQKAQKTALYAHVEGCISDLVSHMFYGIDANFWGLTKPTLASEMPVPQKYYVASRIREAYRPRLEAAELWRLPAVEEVQKSPFEKEKKKKEDYKVTFARAFEGEKILEKARTALIVHARWMDGKQFFFGDRPTSLDVYLAAHILLLADPPFPDSVLQALLLDSYPGLVDHARRVQAEVARAPPYEYFKSSGISLSSLVPRPFSPSGAPAKVDPADIRHRNMTLAFLAGTAGLVGYYVASLSQTLFAAEDPEGVHEDGGTDEEEGGHDGFAGGSSLYTEEDDD